MSAVPETGSLDMLNVRYAMDNIPYMAYLGLLMFVGLIGNSIIVFVYWKKIRKSTSRLFILALCVLDLLTCVVSIPLDLLDVLHNYTFGSLFHLIPCKLSLSVFIIIFASGHILVALGVVRYKKIKNPHGKQVSYTMAKVAIALSVLAAVIVSAPGFVLYGKNSELTPFPNVNGSVCTISDDYMDSKWNFLYLCFMVVLFVTGAVTLVILNSIILVNVLKFANFKPWSVRLQNIEHSGTKDGLDGNGASNLRLTRQRSPLSNDPNVIIQYKCFPSKRKQSVKRTSVMLFLITLMFVLSYLPSLALQAARAVHWEALESLQGPKLAVYNLFLRSYFINSAVNPFIYSYCDLRVRNEVRTIVTFGCGRKTQPD